MGSHREVFWIERYAPPEPGMVLVDEQLLAAGQRMLLVWRSRDPSMPGELCCWTEPSDQLNAVTLKGAWHNA